MNIKGKGEVMADDIVLDSRKSLCKSHLYPSCCLETPSTHILVWCPFGQQPALARMLPCPRPSHLGPGAPGASLPCCLGEGPVIVLTTLAPLPVFTVTFTLYLQQVRLCL